MVILAVDDEQLMLDALTGCIQAAAPGSEVHSFRRPSEALRYAEENPVEVAFLDIEMRGMDGMELGRRLLEIHPEINIIYCTSYDEYIAEAFRSVRCNGYITKPVNAELIATELKHLRVPRQSAGRVKLTLRCFGRFEAFVDGTPVNFESAKTKELLAALTDACGGVCGNQELIVKLWEDDNRHDSYFKKLRKDLFETLQALGCGDAIVRQRGGIGINTEAVDCDYYQWREKNPRTRPENYMTQYPWANQQSYEW